MRLLLLLWKARREEQNLGQVDMRHGMGLLYIRFYGVFFGCLAAIFWFPWLVYYVVFVVYSFWVPQIVTNAYEDARHVMSHRFIVSTALTRLALPLFAFGCPISFWPAAKSLVFCLILAVWQGVQVVVLLLQDMLGPRFFVPARFLPPKYNYHQRIRITPELGPCAVCFEEFDEEAQNFMVTPCNHVFHTECLRRWMPNMTCPTCRGFLPPE
eukprot:TRINITY_DN15667_c0_g1_i1.p1 TRINITY_DN15667_c0_g1~~TRINITY_DN15667_c0_g1_i1.p1  ORF type:complete len:234 (-),score=37.10 TRINITY_DN15667_c0_g1_i1:136-771(-)